MSLFEHIAHLFAVCFIIAVVHSTMRRDTPVSIAFAAARFFVFTILVVGGISAVLYVFTVM